jgi:hypothetical protein
VTRRAALSALIVLGALAGAAGAEASRDSLRLTASLSGIARAHASFGGTVVGTTLAWSLRFGGTATSAELLGTGRTVVLCRPCRAPAAGKVRLTAASQRAS